MNVYQKILSSAQGDIEKVGREIEIPRFCPNLLLLLAQEFVNSSRNARTLERLQEDNIVIVGDIHGNLHNILTILVQNGMPPSQNYIFLGNVIDYGEFSIDVITILFSLKILYPENVCLLGGLSEHCPLHTINGLCEEIETTYGSQDVWTAFCHAFAYLPFACILMNQIFLSHLRVIVEYRLIEKLEAMTLPIEVGANKAYQEFTDFTDHLDENICACFCEENDIDFVICGGDSDCGPIQVTGDSRGFAISSCEYDSDATIFILRDSRVTPLVFHTPRELQRASARFIDLPVGMEKTIEKA